MLLENKRAEYVRYLNGAVTDGYRFRVNREDGLQRSSEDKRSRMLFFNEQIRLGDAGAGVIQCFQHRRKSF